MNKNQPRKVRLHVEDVSYRYPGGTRTLALEGLTLDVHDNEFLAIVGPVGCGKTTFLRIVAGFLATDPARPVQCAPCARPRRPRYVFQEDAIFPWMTVQTTSSSGCGQECARRARGDRHGADPAHRLQGTVAYPRDLSAGMSKMWVAVLATIVHLIMTAFVSMPAARQTVT